MDQRKSLIHDRQAVFARGDAASFRRLRNRVNRAYVSPVALNTTNLRDCAPRRWWNEVQRLGGMQLATRTDPTSIFEHTDSGPDSSLTALANTINNAFLAAPMNSFSPLHAEPSGDVQHTNPPTVTEFCVLKKLTTLNQAKASEPDGLPAWIPFQQIINVQADITAVSAFVLEVSEWSKRSVELSWIRLDII